MWPLPLPPVRRLCSERRLNRAHPSFQPAAGAAGAAAAAAEHVLGSFTGQQGRFPPHSRGKFASFWLWHLSPLRSNAKLRGTKLAFSLFKRCLLMDFRMNLWFNFSESKRASQPNSFAGVIGLFIVEVDWCRAAQRKISI